MLEEQNSTLPGAEINRGDINIESEAKIDINLHLFRQKIEAHTKPFYSKVHLSATNLLEQGQATKIGKAKDKSKDELWVAQVQKEGYRYRLHFRRFSFDRSKDKDTSLLGINKGIALSTLELELGEEPESRFRIPLIFKFDEVDDLTEINIGWWNFWNYKELIRAIKNKPALYSLIDNYFYDPNRKDNHNNMKDYSGLRLSLIDPPTLTIAQMYDKEYFLKWIKGNRKVNVVQSSIQYDGSNFVRTFPSSEDKHMFKIHDMRLDNPIPDTKTFEDVLSSLLAIADQKNN